MFRLLLVLCLLAPAAQAQQPLRLAAAFGPVMMREAGSEAFGPATSGSPLAEGSALRTGDGARAVLALPIGLAALDPGGHLDLAKGDGSALILTRGVLALALRDAPDAPLQVATPRGVAEIRQAGRYLIEATGSTGLQVVAGAARLVTGQGATLVEAGQRAWTPASGGVQRAAAGSVPLQLGWLAGEAPPPPAPAALTPAPLPTPPPVTQAAPQPPPSIVIMQEPYPAYVPTWPVLPSVLLPPVVRPPFVRPLVARPPMARPPIRPPLAPQRPDGMRVFPSALPHAAAPSRPPLAPQRPDGMRVFPSALPHAAAPSRPHVEMGLMRGMGVSRTPLR